MEECACVSAWAPLQPSRPQCDWTPFALPSPLESFSTCGHHLPPRQEPQVAFLPADILNLLHKAGPCSKTRTLAIEIGAGRGALSLLLASPVGQVGCQVLAFESSAESVARAAENVWANPSVSTKIELYHNLLAAVPQLLTVYPDPAAPERTHTWAAASRAWSAPPAGDTRPPTGSAVACAALDDFWLEDREMQPAPANLPWARPVLLREAAAPGVAASAAPRRVVPRDVNLLVIAQQPGADAAALHGARRTLAAGRVPHLWLALTPPSRVGPCDRAAALRWLEGLGYAWVATFDPPNASFADVAAAATYLETHPAGTVSGWLTLVADGAVDDQ